MAVLQLALLTVGEIIFTTTVRNQMKSSYTKTTGTGSKCPVKRPREEFPQGL
jgi:hypothetical protein